MSGQIIYCPPVPYCPPPMPVCRPQPAPWSYTPKWAWNPPYPNPGCGCGAPCGCQPPPMFGPIVGVTDGSNAAPGMVGEFVTFNATLSYAAAPATITQTLSAGVLQPGDWDIWARLDFSGSVGGAFMSLIPQPTGMSNNLFAANSVAPAGEDISLLAMARGSFAVPTLLAFSVTVDSGLSGNPAGTATVYVEARRSR